LKFPLVSVSVRVAGWDEVESVKQRRRSQGAAPASGRSRGELAALTDALRVFASEREWEKFHSPKNLAMALAVEVAELQEPFQWLTERESRRMGRAELSTIAEEVADVQIYLLMLADKLGIDVTRAVEEKIEKNRTRYPVERVRGTAKRERRLEGR
jgi:NTP pyrophosphatase (non-canonical NTP hydrolase)